MQYYEQDNRRAKVWALAGVGAYLALLACVMMLSHTIVMPQPEMGIIVDFGSSDTGFGDQDPAVGDVDTRPSAPAQARPQLPDPEPVITTDDPQVPETVPPPAPEESRPTAPEPAPEPVRQVDQRALFPGRTEGSAATSQGTAGGEGNQGSQQGAPGGGDSAGGSGNSGFSLDGRYLVGNLPRPAYDVEVEGRVVIRITVNASGTVTGAVYEQAGSTTNHGSLVAAARTAALRARFTPSEAEVQTGTITYIFRLN